MKRILKWLETISSSPEAPVEAAQPKDPKSVKPDDDECRAEMSSGVAVAGGTGNEEPGKNVPMPDIYADEHIATVPNLKLVDPSAADSDKSTGFDPYDTAVLQDK